ncbi:MAG: cation transporter [Clostridia bacterium]|nr:cation transporter [Clostridia bacterium]
MAGRVNETEKREKIGIRTSLTAVLVNAVLVIVKGSIGLLSGSIAILGDAVNNLSDAASGIITLWGFHMASRPADARHPYGHGRMEYISGLCIALMVMSIGVNLFVSSVQKCLHPSLIEFSGFMMLLMFLSIAFKAGLMVLFKTVGKRIHSGAMKAAALDSRNDMLVAGGILVATAIETRFHVPADGWIGLLMSVYILYSGVQLVQDQLSPLLGTTPSEETVDRIRGTVLASPAVLGMHDLIIHNYGPDREYASAHIELPATLSALEMHEIADGIEKKLLDEAGIQMVLHCDPVEIEDERIPRMKRFLFELSKSLGMELNIHDLRIVPDQPKSRVIFDCVVPFGSAVSMDSLRQTVVTEFTQYFPDYLCELKMEHSLTGI